jgi:hypothetical protein
MTKQNRINVKRSVYTPTDDDTNNTQKPPYEALTEDEYKGVSTESPSCTQSYIDQWKYTHRIEKLHGSGLHGWGIATGLEVEIVVDQNTGKTSLNVLPGIALDSEGRHISLAVDGIAELNPKADDSGQSATPSIVTTNGINLPTEKSPFKNTWAYLTIQWWEYLTTANNVSVAVHMPWLQLVNVSTLEGNKSDGTPKYDGTTVVLAKVQLDGNGRAIALTADLRQGTSLPTGSLQIQRSGIDPRSTNKIANSSAGEIKPLSSGGLQITVPNLGDRIVFSGEKNSSLEVQANGNIQIRQFPNNDIINSLTALKLVNRGKDGTDKTWALYTAAVGGGFGVKPNAFEIWDYPEPKCRFQILPGGNTILAPDGGNVGIGKVNPTSNLHIEVPGSFNPISALTIDVQSFETSANAQASHFFRVRDIGAGGVPPFYIRGDGNVGIGTDKPWAKLSINGGLHVGGDSDPGDNNLLVDGNSTIGGSLSVTGTSTFTGNVGVGTDTLGAKLAVFGGGGGSVDFIVNGRLRSDNNDGGLWIASDRFVGGHSTDKIGFWNGNSWQLTVQKDGRVGIGTTDPQSILDIQGPLGSGLKIRSSDWSSGSGWHIYHNARDATDDYGLLFVHDDQEKLVIDSEGRIGTPFWQEDGTWKPTTIPRHETWRGGIHTYDLEAEGTIWSKGGVRSGKSDLAENYVSDLDLEAGYVVSLDAEQDKVVLSNQPNDTSVLGVISTAPGLLLNSDPDQSQAKHFPVALCGRVPCKATDENGSIKRGDLLTTSSTPGYAMKAQPIEVAEKQKIFRPGTIIGKALESLTSGKGVIEIVVLPS